MHGMAFVLSLAAMGTDFGWQPTADGKLEYIIQIEPELLDALLRGEEVQSEIPPQVRGVRRFRVRIGRGPVPRDGGMPFDPNRAAPESADSNPGVNVQPVPEQPSAEPPTPNPNALRQPASDDNAFVPGARAALSDDLPNDTNQFVPASPAQPPADATEATQPPAEPENTIQLPEIDLGIPSPPNDNDFQPPALIGDRDDPADPDLRKPSWQRDSPTIPIPEPPEEDANNVMPIPDPDALREPHRLQDDQVRAAIPASDSPKTSAQQASKEDLLGPGALSKDTVSKNTVSKNTVSKSSSNGTPGTTPAETETDVARPWMPLLFTSLALFASIGGNLYLGWIALGVYQRYRAVCEQLRNNRRQLQPEA